MDSKKLETKKELTGVAKIRERYFERRRNWKPSPELEEVTREKKPSVQKKDQEQPEKKIAHINQREDLDL